MLKVPDNQIKIYKKRIKIAGRKVVLADFDIPIVKGFTAKEKKSAGSNKLIDPLSHIAYIDCERHRELEVINRTKRTMIDLAHCNFDHEFVSMITLTTRENMKDLNIGNRILASFLKKLKYVLKKYGYPFNGFDLKYECKPEFQERGAIHYHLVTNLRHFPFTSDIVREWKKQGTLRIDWDERYNIQDLWNSCISGQGTVDLVQIDNGIDSVIDYLIGGYLTKQIDDVRFKDRKSFFTSLNLDKPIIHYNEEAEMYEDYLLEQESVKKTAPWSYTPKDYPEQTIQFREFLLPK